MHQICILYSHGARRKNDFIRCNNNFPRHKNNKRRVDEKQFIFKKIHRSRFLSVLTCILYKTIGTGCEKYQSQWDITLISTRKEHTHAQNLQDYFTKLKGGIIIQLVNINLGSTYTKYVESLIEGIIVRLNANRYMNFNNMDIYET